MSNLLNELSVIMKEVSKLNSRLAELESKESDLSSKILLNEDAKKALLETGVIVGAELLSYHPVHQCFTLSDVPAYAHDINFDEPEKDTKIPLPLNCRSVINSVDCSFMSTKEAEIESENPFKVGDTVNHEMYPSKELVVIFVSGGLVVTDDGDIEGPFSRFSFANKE